ncbi:MAG: DEAD/DEAH box helicase family protein [Anaerolineae bacterium]|nr:DEAD/DEAH box helicase family protein [Anaerolineae bacterium]
MAALQLKFDANQPHQIDAVQRVVTLFEGLPRQTTAFTLSGGEIVANLSEYDDLSESWLLDNLLEAQRQSHFEAADQARRLEYDDGPTLDVGSAQSGSFARYPSFTIEMETGTGKTYVYLRTIYELRQRYGFGKFVIVVPSVAIYEGVRKSFAITRDHFRALYGNEPVNLVEYDGGQLGKLRNFAYSTACEVLLITLAAFDKASNVIYRSSDKLQGDLRPIDYVCGTRPIVILDEPQKMSGPSAVKAIRSLKPLFSLRYSATHKENPNRLYRLTPVDAFRQNLVKKIQVIGVSERENANGAVLELLRVERTGGRITATVRTRILVNGSLQIGEISLHQGDDLFAKTNNRDYANAGYRVETIMLGENGFVAFENDIVIGLRDQHGQHKASIFRAQITKTLETHFTWQAELRPRSIKVLSLFFVDRVENYTSNEGLIRRLFDEEFERLKDDFADFKSLRPEQVREAYFAKKKKPKSDEEEVVLDLEALAAKDRQAAEKAAYALIMRDKERLLSFDEKTCFIFAHSALREGWDNPNVFQICTLRESGSEIERRQAIGRGLRLCVNQSGARVHDEEVNVLTVIANESYKSFASGLQSEYVKAGDQAPPAPKKPRDNTAIRRDHIFKNDFQRFWQKLQTALHYRIHVHTPQLIETAVARLNHADFPQSVIVIERGRVTIAECMVKVLSIGKAKAELQLQLLDEAGEPYETRRSFAERDNLAKIVRDDNLRPFGNFKIEQHDGAPALVFGNGIVLAVGQSHNFAPESAGRIRQRSTLAPTASYPVFNLTERAARELGMTKHSIYQIFCGMREEKRLTIFKNPEGFGAVFINELRNVLADHITEHIEFVPSGDLVFTEPNELFPKEQKYPQKEVVLADARGLYDLIQTDSDEEKAFLETLMQDKRVSFYFKFPPKFRIPLPTIIGNYNPDWGIARLNVDKMPIIHLVRETKGSVDLETLRFPNEKRKIRCAQRYFAALGIDYRPIRGSTHDWWKPETENLKINSQ